MVFTINQEITDEEFNSVKEIEDTLNSIQRTISHSDLTEEQALQIVLTHKSYKSHINYLLNYSDSFEKWICYIAKHK